MICVNRTLDSALGHRCTHKVHFGLALTNPDFDQRTGDPEQDLIPGDEVSSHLNSIADSLSLDSYGVSIFVLHLPLVNASILQVISFSPSSWFCIAIAIDIAMLTKYDVIFAAGRFLWPTSNKG